MNSNAPASRPAATHAAHDPFLVLFGHDDRGRITKLFTNLSYTVSSPAELVRCALDRLVFAITSPPRPGDDKGAAKRCYRLVFVNRRPALAFAARCLEDRRAAR